MQCYPAEKLYSVLQSYAPSQLMDIPLGHGDLIGVIKEQDPMGDKERWFVDNGGERVPGTRRFCTQETLSPRNVNFGHR